MFVFTDNHGSTWKTGSNEVILQLRRGDKASVKSLGSVKVHYYATYFSGHEL